MAQSPRLQAPESSTHPVDVGLRTEAHILAELLRRGYSVLTPFGVNQRYDLVIDQGGRFLRAQCKTGRLRNGAVLFSTQSIRVNTHRTFKRDYVGSADLFLVYCPETREIYSIPLEEAAKGGMSLRVDPTENGQEIGVNWARDYELPG